MHTFFLSQAIALATANVADGGGPFGALIVRDGKVIAASGNRVTARLDPTAHAEIMAIRAACQVLQDFQLTDCVLYSSCEPCPMCLGAIYWSRLREVYFACNRFDAAKAGFDDGFIYDEIPLAPEHRKIAMHGLNIADALSPFQAWYQLGDKTPY
ncbi:MAG: nucleoside deaminase [Methylomonas sp.]|nr:nucleoside deaminase [Methylomonas sp.]PPD21813.1 MAG: tRNA-specific adenosine deaminase [Methylomonas sp.]PPD27498.1 MAG: tRNA-specific adenosine deaminase [Methylomonas sp.]PPD39481.1 MAG: tRNA-specific adenosine deaminase [Methylomonas sp.]PPD42281.1 MAG: tRNA-specific adenosine deaminase [Methylomonas sp.]